MNSEQILIPWCTIQFRRCRFGLTRINDKLCKNGSSHAFYVAVLAQRAATNIALLIIHTDSNQVNKIMAKKEGNPEHKKFNYVLWILKISNSIFHQIYVL